MNREAKTKKKVISPNQFLYFKKFSRQYTMKEEEEEIKNLR